MRNGDGLRVVLFVSGCDHRCFNCQNPQTWNEKSGILFDDTAKQEIIQQLSHDYISGITFSGGDPLHNSNIAEVYNLCKEIKQKFLKKTIWIYTGYTWEDIFSNKGDSLRKKIVELSDVLVDGKFITKKFDLNYPWAGSTNQRVIDVRETLKQKQIILWKS